MSASNTETETETGSPDQHECGFDTDDLDIRDFLRDWYDNLAEWKCSRSVWEKASESRCVWHASDGQTQEKPPAELEKAIDDGDLYGSAAIGVNLTGIDFQADVDFIDANLSGADLEEADLSGVDLRRADLSGANLIDADLSGANLIDADLSGADLRFADLSGADLMRANLSDEADLFDANLSEADLFNANLSKADLSDADLSKAELDFANLSEADLSDANLSEADLEEADLSEADLEEADLSEATLSDADLSEADLKEADLSDANLQGASLDRVGLYQTTLEGLNIDEGTTANPPSLWEQGADDDAESGPFGCVLVRRLRFLRRSASNPEDLQKAEQQYRRFERLYREAGLSRDTDLEIQEKHARRKRALAGGGWGQWLRKAFSRWVLGYGLRIGPVLGVMIVIILLWTLFYPVPGFASQSLEATNEAEIISYETLPPELSMETVRTLRRSLYFSTITFSTLGYADVAPIRWARELAMIESFFGALLMAYLVSVLSRRAIR